MSTSITPSIDNLALTWRSLDEVCTGLTEEQWKTPTGCPGWTVQDNVAHLVDYEAAALGRPRPNNSPAGGEHIKNPLGESNEIGVDARRGWTGEEVLEELRQVAAERFVQLRALTADDLSEPVDTPAGPGTLADMLTLRVMDTWSHEQDIRRALGRPGHLTGPVVSEALRYWTQFLPFVVGKRAGAPDGSTVVFDVGDAHRVAVEVVEGRARELADAPDSPTVRIVTPVATFAALVGGRTDAPDDTTIEGDAGLGRRVVESLGFMP